MSEDEHICGAMVDGRPCGRRCTSLEMFVAHHRACHGSNLRTEIHASKKAPTKQPSCFECKRRFSNKSYLNIHIKTVHGGRFLPKSQMAKEVRKLMDCFVNLQAKTSTKNGTNHENDKKESVSENKKSIKNATENEKKCEDEKETVSENKKSKSKTKNERKSESKKKTASKNKKENNNETKSNKTKDKKSRKRKLVETDENKITKKRKSVIETSSDVFTEKMKETVKKVELKRTLDADKAFGKECGYVSDTPTELYALEETQEESTAIVQLQPWTTNKEDKTKDVSYKSTTLSAPKPTLHTTTATNTIVINNYSQAHSKNKDNTTQYNIQDFLAKPIIKRIDLVAYFMPNGQQLLPVDYSKKSTSKI